MFPPIFLVFLWHSARACAVHANMLSTHALHSFYIKARALFQVLSCVEIVFGSSPFFLIHFNDSYLVFSQGTLYNPLAPKKIFGALRATKRSKYSEIGLKGE